MSRTKLLVKRLYDALPFKQALFSALRLLPVPQRIYQHLHFKGIITVRVPDHGSFRMHHHGYVIENEFFWRGIEGWEKISSELWIRLCRRSNTIIDVGANTGVYALLARTVKPEATIIAVEPVERVFRKMAENIALNGGGIIALNAAATDQEGPTTLYDLAGTEHVLSVSLNADFNPHGSKVAVQVAGMTIAGIAERHALSRLDLLKIDVEGHEPQVLKGFADLLRRDRPSILLEVFNETVAAGVRPMVEGLGYLYYNIDEKTWPPVRTERIGRSGHLNYLLCQPEVARAIGLD